MRLVHRNQGNTGRGRAVCGQPTRGPRTERGQPVEKAITGDPLGGNIHEIEPAGSQIRQHPPGDGGVQ